jgi:hypothetical protein
MHWKDGRVVKVLYDANQAGGAIHKTVDVSDLASGLYLLNIVADGKMQQAKMFEKK